MGVLSNLKLACYLLVKKCYSDALALSDAWHGVSYTDLCISVVFFKFFFFPRYLMCYCYKFIQFIHPHLTTCNSCDLMLDASPIPRSLQASYLNTVQENKITTLSQFTEPLFKGLTLES